MSNCRQSELGPNLELRARIIQAVRRFFIQRQYLEVDTPIRIPAPAPEAHIDAVAAGDWFLQTSPELCMKQLLAAGFPKIFQICKCFRNKERGRHHLPELTMLEWYSAGGAYTDLMDDCQELIGWVAEQTTGGNTLSYKGQAIRLDPPWPRLSVHDAFRRYASVGIEEALARLKPGNPQVAERCELYIAGLELCNGFSELTEPLEQRKRFEAEQETRRLNHKPVYPMPLNFLTALNDMPEACGNARGIDRLVMLFADTGKIDDVVAFAPEEL